MSDQRFKTGMGIGATPELSLRVSVAALVRVLFKHPQDGKTMLALERRTTLYKTETGYRVQIKSQPFGGALRIQDLTALQNLIGDFHFDSQHSQSEQDFRLFVPVSAWKSVQRFCLQHFTEANGLVLESDPRRELEEEFAQALKIRLSSDQFRCQLLGTIIEDHPSPTENIHAIGYPTARIYRVFEAYLHETSLASALIGNSESYSDHDLSLLAVENPENDTAERFSTVLAIPYEQLISFYSTVSPELRNTPALFQNHLLDETVAAVLDVDVPKYQRVVS